MLVYINIATNSAPNSFDFQQTSYSHSINFKAWLLLLCCSNQGSQAEEDGITQPSSRWKYVLWQRTATNSHHHTDYSRFWTKSTACHPALFRFFSNSHAMHSQCFTLSYLWSHGAPIPFTKPAENDLGKKAKPSVGLERWIVSLCKQVSARTEEAGRKILLFSVSKLWPAQLSPGSTTPASLEAL